MRTSGPATTNSSDHVDSSANSAQLTEGIAGVVGLMLIAVLVIRGLIYGWRCVPCLTNWGGLERRPLLPRRVNDGFARANADLAAANRRVLDLSDGIHKSAEKIDELKGLLRDRDKQIHGQRQWFDAEKRSSARLRDRDQQIDELKRSSYHRLERDGEKIDELKGLLRDLDNRLTLTINNIRELQTRHNTEKKDALVNIRRIIQENRTLTGQVATLHDQLGEKNLKIEGLHSMVRGLVTKYNNLAARYNGQYSHFFSSNPAQNALNLLFALDVRLFSPPTATASPMQARPNPNRHLPGDGQTSRPSKRPRTVSETEFEQPTGFDLNRMLRSPEDNEINYVVERRKGQGR